jgi:hypothetical protein
MTDDRANGAGQDAAIVRPFLAGRTKNPDSAAGSDSAVRISPFLLTKGRTAGDSDIAIEAQVSASALGIASLDTLSFEYRDIVDLCREPLAVAEVAARLNLHLGVVRVLIGDLAHQELVSTFQADSDLIDEVDTIERVIDGLRQRT